MNDIVAADAVPSLSETILTDSENHLVSASPIITSSKPATIIEPNTSGEKSLDSVPSTSVPIPPIVPRFTPKGATLLPFVPVIDPITGIASKPAVSILPRKRTRGVRKNKKSQLANAATGKTGQELNNRSMVMSNTATVSGVTTVRTQNAQVQNNVEPKLRRGHGVVNNASGGSRVDDDSRNSLPRPVPTRLQLQQQHHQQQLNLSPQQRAQDDGVIGGLIVAKHFREQVSHIQLIVLSDNKY